MKREFTCEAALRSNALRESGRSSDDRLGTPDAADFIRGDRLMDRITVPKIKRVHASELPALSLLIVRAAVATRHVPATNVAEPLARCSFAI